MNIAVIKTGGKQYKVKKDDILSVEKLDFKKDSKIDFEDILAGKVVKAKVMDSIKGPKISNLKFKNKTGYTRRLGHRQNYTMLKILDIK
jgi:large subunit ribosomal protein L21